MTAGTPEPNSSVDREAGAKVQAPKDRVQRKQRRPPSTTLAEITHKVLLESLTPPSVLIDRNFGILHSHGATDQFLEQSPGEPTNDLLKRCSVGLGGTVQAAVLEADASKMPASHLANHSGGKNGKAVVRVLVHPIVQGSHQFFLVSFQEENSREFGERARTSKRLELALDAGKLGVWSWEIASGICKFDETVASLLGLDEGAETMHISEFEAMVHPDDRARMGVKWDDMIQGRLNLIADELRIILPDGSQRWLSSRAAPLVGPNGQVVELIGLNYDISERKQAESELLESKNQLEIRVRERTAELRVLSENVPALFAFVGSDLRFKFVNRIAAEYFQFHTEDVANIEVKKVFSLDTFRELKPKFKKALNGKLQEFEVLLEIANDGERVARMRCMPQIESDGTTSGFFMLADDITEERRLQKEVLAAAEHEKYRIGRDLHDSICQELAGIGMFGKVLAKDLEKTDSDKSNDAAELVRLINDVTQKSRLLARGLAPVFLEKRTLTEAITELAESVNSLNDDVECHIVENSIGELELEEFFASQIYLILRESVFNATRHGSPTRVEIRLYSEDNCLVFTVCDDGGGVASDIVPGLGLRSMGYRARTLGGKIEMLDSNRGGIRMECRIRLESGTDTTPIE